MTASRRNDRARVKSMPEALARALVAALAISLAALAAMQPAQAQIGSARYASIVIDAATGSTLSEANADAPRFPASLTKMMTLYMTFEALRDRRISLQTLVPVSPHAASMSPTKLDLQPGTKLTVEQAILGLVTKSANDAAAALGELLGGDETRFGQMMTLRARALGMTHTVFRNASGLPDPAQISTARDLALLARHLVRDFPDDYHYFSAPSFTFHGRLIPNHDYMLRSYPGADGIKTGYTEAAGFNLVTSAMRGNVRLIGVVLGAARPGERDIHMASLLDRGFVESGVPIEMARRDRIGGGLIASAQAATEDAAIHTPAPPAWAATTGAYPSEAAAQSAAGLAQRAAEAGEVRVEPAGTRRHPLWRAVIGGLSQTEARAACAALQRRHSLCSVRRDPQGQIASR
jgi:D-alanyl-D-alanine carboxypeptidase